MREQVFQLADNIHYGAVVTLRFIEGSNNKYVCSDGISIRNLITLSQMDNMIDISTVLFVVLPPIKFQFERDMQKVLREKYGKNGDQQFKQKNTIGVIDQFEFEVTENNEIIEKLKRSPVKYGQSFMLQHLHSCRYLSYTRLSDNSSEYFLELLEIPNSNSYFSFEACYAYQDQISSYIKFDSPLFVNMKIESEIEVREAALNYKRGNILEEWEVSFQRKAPMHVSLYQTADPIEPQFIYYGEPLWIFHLETSSFLKLMNPTAALESFFFRKIKSALNLESSSHELNLEQSNILLQRTKNELSAEKLGLWKIEAANRFQGGKIKFDHQIRLFNIRYKVYLCVQKTVVKRKQYYRLSTEKHHSDNTLFRMKPLSASSNFVTSSDLIILEHILSKTYLGVNLDIVNLHQQPVFEIAPNPKYKNQDNFKFTKASFMQNWENNFVISVLPFLEEGSMMLQKANGRQLRKKEESFLRFLRETLIEIMNFSEDLSECFEISDNKLGKVSFNHYQIQKILRQQGFLQLTASMLDRIDPAIFRKRKTQYEQQFRMSGLSQILLQFLQSTKYNEKEIELDLFLMESIVRIALKFLSNATKYNVQSSSVLFEQLGVCIKFLGMNIGAEDFFESFFKNNLHLHNKENIPFVQIVNQYKSLKLNESDYFPEMFKVLSPLLIDSEEQGNAKNQTELFELLVVKKSMLLLPIFNVNDKLYAHFKGQSTQLEEFVRTMAVHPNLVQMVTEQLKFFSQLIFGRNYVCSKHFKDIYSINLLINYLQSSINSDVKASLLELLMMCFIDERPRFREKFPNLTYSFREVEVRNRMDSYRNQSVDSREKETERQNRKYEDVIELTKTRSMNFQESVVRELLETISLKDAISSAELEDIKRWVIDTIENYIKAPSIEQFYEQLNHKALACLKKMIEMSLFSLRESEEITRLILEIIRKLRKAMTHQEQGKDIVGEDFNAILREMLAKNILKKFNNRSRFDGLEDEITMSNISLRFVKYAYYQNLFLFKSINHQKDHVIETVLKLISNATQLRVDQRIRSLINDMKEVAAENLDVNESESPKLVIRFLKEKLIKKALVEFNSQAQEELMESLLLNFYESNKYTINEQALIEILTLVFEHKYFTRSLQKVIIIADAHVHSVYENIKQNYFSVKLLVETCEIWMTPNYEDPKFLYSPVVHHMIDRLNMVMNLLIDGSPHKLEDILMMSRYEKALEKLGVSIQRQIILRNMRYAQQIILFLRINFFIVAQLQRRNERNKSVFDLFQTCFNLLYMYILDCREAKQSIKHQLPFLLQLVNECQVQLGQTHILIEYLKNNYEECLNFIEVHLESFMNKIVREGKYNFLSVRLLKTVSSSYGQPINQSIKKLFFWLFDISAFRKFMFIIDNVPKQGMVSNVTQHVFQLDLGLLGQPHVQPVFYHIEALDVMLFTRDNLEESKNILRTNIKNTLESSYIFQILSFRDYFSDEHSNDPELKLNLLFKVKIMELLDKIFLNQDQQQSFYEQLQGFLLGQLQLFRTFLDEFDMRKETATFKKVSLGTSPKKREGVQVKLIEENLSEFVRGNTNYFALWKKEISRFCHSVERYSTTIKGLVGCEPIAKDIIGIILRLSRMLYEPDQTAQHSLEVPSRWMISPPTYKDEDAQRTHRFTSACILQAGISKQIQQQVRKRELSIVGKLQGMLYRSSINMFKFFRKIAEFIEDTIEKLVENGEDLVRMKLVCDLLRFLRMSLQVGSREKQEEVRILMSKSQIIFPFFNYLQISKLTHSNVKVLRLFVELLSELISQQGNKTIQKILYQYFSNKPESFQMFAKIKQVVEQVDEQKIMRMRSRGISSAMVQLKREARGEQTNEYSMLQFLILLCRGNNRKNQLFLTGLNKQSSFDIIKILLSILRAQTNEHDGIPLINLKNYKLILQCFGTIRALVEGPCNENQQLFVSSSFFEISYKYLKFHMQNDQEVAMGFNLPTVSLQVIDQIGEVSQVVSARCVDMLKLAYEVDMFMVSQIKYKCIGTVLGLLEENISDNAINKLMLSIPAEQIIININKAYERYTQKSMKYEQENLQVEDDRQLILPLGFKLYFALQEYIEKGLEIKTNTQPLQFFKTHTKTIEVLHNRLFTLRFPEPPIEISKAFQKEFLETADRTSINSKLKDLQDTQIKNRSNQPGLVLTLLVFIVNIMDLIIFHDDQIQFAHGFSFYSRIGVWDPASDTATEQIVEIVTQMIALAVSVTFFVFEIIGAVYIKRKMREIHNDPTLTKWGELKAHLILIFKNLGYYYYFFTSIILIIGMFSPFFDTILLIVELFKQNETFFEIGKAIKESMVQLLVVLLIFFISNYILIVLIYFIYSTEYSYCQDSLFSCLSFGLDVALKTDFGVIGINDNPDTITTDFMTDTVFNVLFDFVYLFIIKIIIEQVLGAIIVDKFAQIREETEKRDEDEQTKCYICGMDVEIFDREEDGFEKHKEEYHNVWNYFLFLYYLENSKVKDLTGVELFVHNCREQGSLKWFPINRSLHLENKRKEGEIQAVEADKVQQDTEQKLLDDEIAHLRKTMDQIAQLVNYKLFQKEMKE